ncbi:MAG: tRNA (adenosine(37)-N6)-dimethylallyltransferase MiaA [Bacillota bacterium]
MERKVFVITGPTCSGKTFLCLNLAERLDTEIISADSRQIFKFLDIGTAKPSQAELAHVKHHFIDELTPDQEFNVSKFEAESLDIIESLHKENKIPVAVGGSGLYIKALVDGIFNTADTDEQLRNELKSKMDEHGQQYLYDELKRLDPEAAETMLPQNWKRVIRALEVFHLTGKSILQHHKDYQRETGINFIQIGLNWQRSILYANIEARVDKMIDAGLVDEVKGVLEMGYSRELNSLNTVGYKEIISYLENEITLDRAIELIKRNTRRFAKRQLTWFRADQRIAWFDVSGEKDLIELTRKVIKL